MRNNHKMLRINDRCISNGLMLIHICYIWVGSIVPNHQFKLTNNVLCEEATAYADVDIYRIKSYGINIRGESCTISASFNY